MELQPFEQAAALLQHSRNPLIIIPEQPSTDAIAGALGLLLMLEKMGQNAKVVSPRFTLPPDHSFLPKSHAIEQQLTNLRSFIITVNLERAPVDSLSYTIDGDRLHLYLTPKRGFYDRQDVSTSAGSFAHDVIVTLDAPSPERLGDLYEDNAEFFYHTPIINIDHHTTNSRFGQVNLVDVVANSVSEIIFELIKRLGFELLDEQVATSLLAGIITKTKAFQSQAVTPRSLAIASHLVSSGARREDIIRELYQTKSIAGLKLWGRALSRLQTDQRQRVVWSSLTKEDLQATATKPNEASGVLDELIVNAPGAYYYCLFVETPAGVTVALNHRPDAPVPTPFRELTRQTPQDLRGTVPGPLADVEARFIRALKEAANNQGS
ncbi:MAG: hypothetical protein HYY50_05480 [Candidatus Kerfeldbacteria bacterium]|nr:hypothetical protein [Candidatus Kerfeldbacteria bacterium]